LIFFAYINIICGGILSPLKNHETTLGVMTATITLCYLGTSFEMIPIAPDDWKRRWLIVMAYINIVVLGMGLLVNIGYSLQ
jgi:hypothetical protein